jgi:cardiolipin synthase
MKVLRHLPNLLTWLRLMAAPATAALLFEGHYGAAFGIFALAGLSDAADGFLAKRYNLTSPLGSVLDPAADKALMLAAFATLAVLNDVPGWLAFLVIARDALIVLGVLIAFAAQAPLAMKPLVIGKVCTVLQVLYIGVHLASLAFEFPLGGIAPADAYVLAGITVASWFAYSGVWFAAMRMPRNVDARRA